MPRTSVLITPAIDVGAAIQWAASDVWQRLAQTGEAPEEFTLRLLDGGVAVQLCVLDEPVLTVLRPRPLPGTGELQRVLPGVTPPPTASSWTEAATPWTPNGAVGMAVLEVMARGAGGIAVHHDLATGETAVEQ